MFYVSTRGDAPKLNFTDAVLAGLARDGGLYVPEVWPQFSKDEIRAFSGRSYADIAKAVIAPFNGGAIEPNALNAMIDAAYASFRHKAVTPLTQLGPNEWTLELFHGPTLAFKDCAMQLLGRLMDHALKEKGQRATIICATSGDTGGAAVAAFKGLEQVDMVTLFPTGRVSDVQRRMMTTAADSNIHTLSIDGHFDDCQAIVKALFNNHAFRDEVRLSGVNSINWARIVAQVVYYFVAAVALGAPDREMRFVVPTGNFGDIFAGFVAQKMGLPIADLCIATNKNDILARTLATGSYEVRGVAETTSPSMDIQVSSNFERLLFEAYGRDSTKVKANMASLAQSGAFSIGQAALAAIRKDFSAGKAEEHEVAACIKATLAASGVLIDPHTAVAVVAARKTAKDPAIPTIILSTAHPAKFPDAVEAACGHRPPLPEWCGDLMEHKEVMTRLPNDEKMVRDYIHVHSRAGKSA